MTMHRIPCVTPCYPLPQHSYSTVTRSLQGSDVDRALANGSLSVEPSPRSLHNIDGLGSPVAIKSLAKAVLMVSCAVLCSGNVCVQPEGLLQENHRLDPISPRIYSTPSAQLINMHLSSSSDEEAEDE